MLKGMGEGLKETGAESDAGSVDFLFDERTPLLTLDHVELGLR